MRLHEPSPAKSGLLFWAISKGHAARVPCPDRLSNTGPHMRAFYMEHPMTAQQKIKHLILLLAIKREQIAIEEAITAENVDALYEKHDEDGGLQDARNEIRCGEHRTEVKDQTPWSRGLSYFESHSVAAKAPDGSYVGWTYWYGGGKHAEPEAISWMEFAYDLTHTEKQVMVTEHHFELVAKPAG